MVNIEIIKHKLEEMDENYDSLSPKIKGYLDGIEAFLQGKHSAQAQALVDLKAAEYSLSEVTKAIGCARGTLYNNPILKAYIEYSIELDNKNNPYKVADDLRASRQKLQEQVHLMEVRDVQTEQLKAENAQLMRTLAEKEKEIERLQNRVHELSGELHQLKSSTPKPVNSVLQFSPK